MTCSSCDVRAAVKAGRCEACYRYELRNGRPRPYEILVRYAERAIGKVEATRQSPYPMARGRR